MKQIIFASILVLVFGVSALAQNVNTSCPTIEVIGDGVVMPGEPMFFTVKLSDEAKNLNLEYEWTVSAGTIAKGQGSRSITIDTASLSGVDITATVKIKGLPENCANEVSETSAVLQYICILPIASDEYGKLPLKEEYARLDAFFISLINNPTDKGFIVISIEETETIEQTKKHIQKLIKHVKYRKFPIERLVFAIEKVEKPFYHSTKFWRIPEDAEFSPCEDCEIIKGIDF